jgi:hypothetical protein
LGSAQWVPGVPFPGVKLPGDSPPPFRFVFMVCTESFAFVLVKRPRCKRKSLLSFDQLYLDHALGVALDLGPVCILSSQND